MRRGVASSETPTVLFTAPRSRWSPLVSPCINNAFALTAVFSIKCSAMKPVQKHQYKLTEITQFQAKWKKEVTYANCFLRHSFCLQLAALVSFLSVNLFLPPFSLRFWLSKATCILGERQRGWREWRRNTDVAFPRARKDKVMEYLQTRKDRWGNRRKEGRKEERSMVHFCSILPQRCELCL